MIKPVILFAFLNILWCCPCKGQDSTKRKFNPQSIELNNQAVDLLVTNGWNINDFPKAIELLNKAIELDSTYFQAHTLKSNLLCKQGLYREAINVLDRILTINPQLIEIKFIKAAYLDIMGDTSGAQLYYKEVIEHYGSRIRSESDNVSLRLMNASMYFFINEKERAFSEFARIESEFPTNEEVIFSKKVFEEFDKKEFLNDICERKF